MKLACVIMLFAVLRPPLALASCADSISSSPMCMFGAICDCSTLTVTSECGGTITSAMGSILVNDVCEQFCGVCGDGGDGGDGGGPTAAPTIDPVLASCADSISSAPMCMFGGICDCSTLTVTSECGGTFTSARGSILVNDVCEQFCGVCGDGGDGGGPTAAPTIDPVVGTCPMGDVDGGHSSLAYNITNDTITFTMTFPDTLAWIGFHFWGSIDMAALSNGLLQSTPAGYECMVTETLPVAAHCRVRHVRHSIMRSDDLPDQSLLETSLAGSECSATQAQLEYEGTPFCTHNTTDAAKSSFIVKTRSNRVLVTDLLADAYSIDVVLTHANGEFVAIWSQARDYPFRVQDGSRKTVRWATSPRGVSDFVVTDLQYHGYISEAKWVVGYDYIYTDVAAQSSAAPRYNVTVNVNEESWDPEEFETHFETFYIAQSTNPEGPEDAVSPGCSTMSMTWSLVACVFVSTLALLAAV